VTLADQDRTRWNRAAITEGSAWLSEAVTRSGGAFLAFSARLNRKVQ
jgi:predicted RNA polymerase sigma factor